MNPVYSFLLPSIIVADPSSSARPVISLSLRSSSCSSTSSAIFFAFCSGKSWAYISACFCCRGGRVDGPAVDEGLGEGGWFPGRVLPDLRTPPSSIPERRAALWVFLLIVRRMFPISFFLDSICWRREAMELSGVSSNMVGDEWPKRDYPVS